MEEEKKKKISIVRLFPPRVGESGARPPDMDAPIRIHSEGKDSVIVPETRDVWGRNTAGWIEVGGKMRPHP